MTKPIKLHTNFSNKHLKNSKMKHVALCLLALLCHACASQNWLGMKRIFGLRGGFVGPCIGIDLGTTYRFVENTN